MKLNIIFLLIATLLLTWQGMDMLTENSLPAEETKKEACIHILSQQKKQHPQKPAPQHITFVSERTTAVTPIRTANRQPAVLFIRHRALLL